jgi:uncharacterized protein
MVENLNSGKKILIAGGTGFIGSVLAEKLTDNGYEVVILSRNSHKKSRFNTFYWDIQKEKIQEGALSGIDCIINLSGENISKGRWTTNRKKEIEESRVKSALTLFDAVQKLEKKPEAYISASATGYYGFADSNKIFTESDINGSDFLADICQKWESAAKQFESIGIRTTILRTGVVLDKSNGAFPQLSRTLKLGFISAIGSGKQYLPWIYIDDLIKMYLFAIENYDIKGIYNAVAPEHISQADFVQKIRNISGRKIKSPNIPAIILRAIMGEMASIILKGNMVSSDKILNTGFQFDFPDVDSTLHSLLNKNDA